MPLAVEAGPLWPQSSNSRSSKRRPTHAKTIACDKPGAWFRAHQPSLGWLGWLFVGSHSPPHQYFYGCASASCCRSSGDRDHCRTPQPANVLPLRSTQDTIRCPPRALCHRMSGISVVRGSETNRDIDSKRSYPTHTCLSISVPTHANDNGIVSQQRASPNGQSEHHPLGNVSKAACQEQLARGCTVP